MGSHDFAIGMDVGSTTVKAVLVDCATQRILWHDYKRHNAQQPELALTMLSAMGTAHHLDDASMFVTGSGAPPLCEALGAPFVQEVNAVTMAVQELHPDAGSVIELGGQDAKVIIFKDENDASGNKIAIPSMNDKCAAGTGATIDKCMIKIGAQPEFAHTLHFDHQSLHHVAAKCGVFAETDVVHLIKSGIPKGEVLNSLADAIVLQNLSVLTRGCTLKHKVILLGGPNTYLPFLQQCWRLRIPQTWDDRGYDYPKDTPIEELIFVPPNANLYAAYGATVFGMTCVTKRSTFRGVDSLQRFIARDRHKKLQTQSGPPLSKTQEETQRFIKAYQTPAQKLPMAQHGEVMRCVIGIDGGSTSSKAVLVDEEGDVVAKAYQLSKGNPIQDAMDLLQHLKGQIESCGARIECLGLGATGYAADVLDEVMLADVNIVETIAHMTSAVRYFGDIDVVCDVGGQDIKILMIQNGDIKGFKLSNSCSAGNGMLLQTMADQFGIDIGAYADLAFTATVTPQFSPGCAVFLDTNRVNFQKEGYQPNEMLAGLAQVLPKNIWQYVAQIPRMASLGTRFVLQGGTQYNLAALKAQVDYIHQRVPGASVMVHPHTGEAGAIGAAIETLRCFKRTNITRFIGIEAALQLRYATQNNASTVCHFCPNQCKRTFIDTKRPDGSSSRYIAGFSCERGAVQSEEAMLEVVRQRKNLGQICPNLMDDEAKLTFLSYYKTKPLPEADTPIEDIIVQRGLLRIKRRTVTRGFRRSTSNLSHIRIGMPRVLNMYSTAPFFRAYFETLGIEKHNVVFSDATSESMWTEGGKYGSTDPCFPSKVCQAHLHNLLFHKHNKARNYALNYIFFPIVTHVNNFITDAIDDATCTVVAGTPDVMRAAFTKETDFFAERNIEYLAPALSFAEPNLLMRRMYETWGPRLGVTEDESDFACAQGRVAIDAVTETLESRGKKILEEVEATDRLAIVVLGRPYHADPGLNHDIAKAYQSLGYPILTIRSIPKSRPWIDRFYQPELDSGTLKSPFELNHLWPENYSANSAQRVWAAGFSARHPNIAVLDLSSFKCGHDAPTYALIESILSASKTPFAAMHDLDATKPGGSIQIRVKTYAYSLRLHREGLEALRQQHIELNASVARKRLSLLQFKKKQLAAQLRIDPQLEERIRETLSRVQQYRTQMTPTPDDAGVHSDWVTLRHRKTSVNP